MPVSIKVRNIPLDAIRILLNLKLVSLAWAYANIEKNNGYFPYPVWLRDYFSALGVEHWAEFYFEEKIQSVLKKAQSECDFLTVYIYKKYGSVPTNEQVIQAVKDMSDRLAKLGIPFDSLEFLNNDPDIESIASLTQEEKDQQRDVLMSFQLTFFNDLSVATHGESIVVLIQKAVSEGDLEALTKAIQIDRTIISYFYKVFEKKHLKGDSDFFDAIAYRLKNPPNRGKVKHPLLWILFKDLFHFGCLRKDILSKQILDLYNNAVSEFPQFLINDEQIVRRQRQQFIRKYRPLK